MKGGVTLGIPLPVTATLDERTATAAANRAAKVFEDAGKKASEALSGGVADGAREAERSLKQFGDRASDAYDKARDAAGRLRSEEERLQDLRDRGARSSQIVSQAERVERARRAEVRAIRDATDALGEYQQAADRAGSAGGDVGASFLGGLRGAGVGAASSGREMASEFASGFAGASALTRLGAAGGPVGIALAGTAILGFAAGKTLADQFAAGLDSLQQRDLIASRIGVDDAQMARFGQAAGAAWVNGWGASVQDNLGAVQFAVQAGLLDPAAGEQQAQQLIERLQTVSARIGEDPRAIARGARNFVATGLAASPEEAFDLLTAAQGRGLDLTGDLIDTAEEYGTALHAVGLTGADSFGLISQMMQGGIRNTDVAADSLKELAISVSDNSELTRNAFAALGFNADDMNRRFAEGGPIARQAFGEVLDALAATDDQTEKNQIGLALFKTKWEDAGTAIQKADLPTAAAELGKVAGATDDATEKLSAHTNGWDQLGRSIDDTMGKLQRWLADTAIGQFFTQTMPSTLAGTLDKLFSGGYWADDPAANPNAPAGAGPGKWVTTGSGQTIWVPGGAAAPPAPGPFREPVPVPTSQLNPPDGPLRQDRVPMPDGTGTGSEPKFSAPESEWTLASIPLGSFPGEEGLASRGVAPGVSPGAAFGPGGQRGLGYYEVDPQRVFDAETSKMNAETSLQNARYRYLEVMADADADEQDKYNARQALVTQGRALQSAEAKLAEAQQGTWKKMEQTAQNFSKGMDQIGAALDNDFGISEGLPGLAENIVKFLANLAAAPVLGALGAVSQVAGEDGGGLVGMLAANGVFGSQFLPQRQGVSPSALGPAGLRPGLAGLPGVPAGGSMGTHAQIGFAEDIANRFGLDMTSGLRNWAGTASGQSWHLSGQAGDFSNGSGNTPEMRAFAQYMSDNFAPYLQELIYSDPGFSGNIFQGQPHQYSAGTLADHRNHVHVAIKDQYQKLFSQMFGNTTDRMGDNYDVPFGPGGQPWSADWNAMAQKEASGNWQANTGNGYYGGLQFLPSSWEAAGGLQYAARPDLATPYQQAMAGESLLGLQGPGAWPNTFTPGSAGPSSGLNLTPATGTPFPANPSGAGPGLGGAPMDLLMGATAGLDALAPGAGVAAKIGIQEINRAIQYGGQVAGIGVSGLMETLLPAGSPLASIGNSWFGKLASGFAAARPALPNMAGQQAAPPNPNDAQRGADAVRGKMGGDITNNVTVNNTGATEEQNGRDVTRHLTAAYTPSGANAR